MTSEKARNEEGRREKLAQASQGEKYFSGSCHSDWPTDGNSELDR